jgi:TRAP transporter TAXI family solute receptor
MNPSTFTFQRRQLCVMLGAAATLGLASGARAQAASPQTDRPLPGISLPRTMVWTAYPTGTTGYAQAVAIGSVLQNLYNVSLRVLPGRNDVSRLEPVRLGRASLAFGGTEVITAQEGMRDFGLREWGPQPLRMILLNRADACSFAIQVPRDSEIRHPRDLRGRRVPYVMGAASPNAGFEFYLRYANLTWNDVQRVEIGGYMAMIEAFIDGRLDAKWNACHSAVLHRVAQSPRGFRFLEFPHADREATARVSEEAPWFRPHVARNTVGIDVRARGVEVFSSPYPLMASLSTKDADHVYSLVRIMDRHHNMYRAAAPGMEGWQMDRQLEIEDSFMPFHDGAIRYFREIGRWTATAQRNHERRLERQRVLQRAWEDYGRAAPRDPSEFQTGWMRARHEALTRAGQEPLARTWPVVAT